MAPQTVKVPAIDPRKILVCPVCRGPLQWRDTEAVCTSCEDAYPLIDGIPFMVSRAERQSGNGGGFDGIAEIYDATLPSHVTEHYLNKRVGLLSGWLKGSTVLDVGGGTGALGQRLLSRGYDVLATDASLGMLQVYKSKTSTVPVGAMAYALPFPSECFDSVVSVALLHHVARPEAVRAVLGEMYRVLRRGGTMVIWDHNPANPYWPILMKKVPQDSGGERLIPLAEIRRGLREAGATRIQALKSGFIPDFVPPALLPAMRWIERALERTPLAREWAAHNVVVVRKE